MKMTTLNWNPTSRQLRQFALGGLVAAPLIAWTWGGGHTVVSVAALTAVVAATVGLIWPAMLKPAYRLLTLLTWPIGFVAGEVFLAASFFLVFLPLGLLGRLLGRRALTCGFDPAAATYWEEKAQPADPRRYFRQF